MTHATSKKAAALQESGLTPIEACLKQPGWHWLSGGLARSLTSGIPYVRFYGLRSDGTYIMSRNVEVKQLDKNGRHLDAYNILFEVNVAIQKALANFEEFRACGCTLAASCERHGKKND